MNNTIEQIANTMGLNQKQIEYVSHNISNQATPGYKAIKSAPDIAQMFSEHITNSKLVKTELSSRQGSLSYTGNKSELAINGKGYFLIESKEASAVLLSRSLKMNVSTEGILVDSMGSAILIDGKAFETDGKIPLVDNNGNVFSNGNKVGKLSVASIMNSEIVTIDPFGRIKVQENNLLDEESSSVIQGAIENSNVNTTDEMVKLMQLSKQIETNQRVFRMLESVIGSGINDIGNN